MPSAARGPASAAATRAYITLPSASTPTSPAPVGETSNPSALIRASTSSRSSPASREASLTGMSELSRYAAAMYSGRKPATSVVPTFAASFPARSVMPHRRAQIGRLNESG